MFYLSLIIIYTLLLCFILLLSIGRLFLVRYQQKHIPSIPPILEEYPTVTIQLPIYNELYVVERLIEAVTALDYPAGQLQIQILDDSTDETGALIEQCIEQKRKEGWRIDHMIRAKNTGFKAGALQAALPYAMGEYIAIFDSDFIPHPDFLSQLLPHFTHPKIGMVQAGWEHLNEDFSLLTRLQAFGLDAHFRMEQAGRHAGGLFINFNGTAGIWRKSCIEDAGGWQHDTLTEDLDLSYRAQLKNWKMVFVNDSATPAELPIAMNAIKSQQFRWTKGSVETAKKIIPMIWGASITLKQGIFALLHLMNPFVFPAVFLSALLSVPLLWVKQSMPQYLVFFQLASIFVLGLLAMFYFHWKAARSGSEPMSKSSFFKLFPLFMALSSGLSYHNTKAVLSGIIGLKTPFIRTPKMGWGRKLIANKYVNQRLSTSAFIELLLSIYFIGGIALGIYLHDYGLIPFHLVSAIGFGVISSYSIAHAKI